MKKSKFLTIYFVIFFSTQNVTGSPIRKNIFFENLTYAPIDVDLIDFKLLDKKEKKYLSNYHLNTYNKLAKYLNLKERKWLLNLI